MKTTRYIAIEPAENGWVVLETICRESDKASTDNEDDEDESEGYDPSREFARRGQPGHGHGPHGPHCQHEDEKKKIHVFGDHEKLMAFVAEKTRDFSSSST